MPPGERTERKRLWLMKGRSPTERNTGHHSSSEAAFRATTYSPEAPRPISKSELCLASFSLMKKAMVWEFKTSLATSSEAVLPLAEEFLFWSWAERRPIGAGTVAVESVS